MRKKSRKTSAEESAPSNSRHKKQVGRKRGSKRTPPPDVLSLTYQSEIPVGPLTERANGLKALLVVIQEKLSKEESWDLEAIRVIHPMTGASLQKTIPAVFNSPIRQGGLPVSDFLLIDPTVSGVCEDNKPWNHNPKDWILFWIGEQVSSDRSERDRLAVLGSRGEEIVRIEVTPETSDLLDFVLSQGAKLGSLCLRALVDSRPQGHRWNPQSGQEEHVSGAKMLESLSIISGANNRIPSAAGQFWDTVGIITANPSFFRGTVEARKTRNHVLYLLDFPKVCNLVAGPKKSLSRGERNACARLAAEAQRRHEGKLQFVGLPSWSTDE